MNLAKDFIKIGGKFPLTSALDNLHAIERMDTRLIAAECISIAELAKRRKEVGELINKVKRMLKEV